MNTLDAALAAFNLLHIAAAFAVFSIGATVLLGMRLRERAQSRYARPRDWLWRL